MSGVDAHGPEEQAALPQEPSCSHQWVELDLSCETCGDHPGLYCTVCMATVDFVFEKDPR